MKLTNRLSFLLAVFLICLSACQKPIIFVEGSGPGGSGGLQVFLKAKVDGVQYESSTVFASIMPGVTGNTIQIMANKGNEAFSLMLDNFTGIGTYDLMNNHICSYASDILNPNKAYNSIAGNVKITMSTDKFVKGTFEFKGINVPGDEISITEGSFLVSLVYENTPPPADDKSMSAKIDGTLMNFTAAGNYIKSASLGNIMTIVGANGEKTLLVSMDGYHGLGTYDIDIDAQGSYHTDSGFSGIYDTVAGVKTGSVIVTSATSNTIKGTFSFSAPNSDPVILLTKTIMEGKFDVRFQTITAP